MKTELPQQTTEKTVAEKSPKKKRHLKANEKFSPTQKLRNKRKRIEGGYITNKNKPKRKPKAPTSEPEPSIATDQRKKKKAPKQKPEKPEKTGIHAKLDSIVTAIGRM